MNNILIKKLAECYDLLKKADNVLMDAMDEAEKEEATYDIYDELIEPSNNLGDIKYQIDNILDKAKRLDAKDSKFKDGEPEYEFEFNYNMYWDVPLTSLGKPEYEKTYEDEIEDITKLAEQDGCKVVSWKKLTKGPDNISVKFRGNLINLKRLGSHIGAEDLEEHAVKIKDSKCSIKRGDKVKVPYHNNTYGTVLKVSGDVATVEYETKDGITRKDYYYLNELCNDSIKDSKPASTTDIKNHIIDFVDQWLNNDYDEESEKYNDAFINIRDDDKLLTRVALKLKKILIDESLDLHKLEDTPDVNYWTYDLLKKFARR